MARVFISRRVPQLLPRLLEEAGHQVELHDSELPPSRELLLEGAVGADALVTLVSDTVDEELLDAAGPGLKLVANYAVGVDNVDFAACAGRGVLVSNTPGVLTAATADQAMALLLAVARRTVEGHELVRSGSWRGWHPLQLLGKELSGATVGVVGMGRIGSEFARRARGFGMRVVYHNRSRNREAESELGASYRPELGRLLEESDVLSLHAPLSEATRHLIDTRALDRMKPDAILINTARGALVDEAALVTALTEGRLWGAGLDVFEEEPRLAPGLAELPNVVLAPHLGSATDRTREEMARLCGEAVLAVLAGRKPDNLVEHP